MPPARAGSQKVCAALLAAGARQLGLLASINLRGESPADAAAAGFRNSELAGGKSRRNGWGSAYADEGETARWLRSQEARAHEGVMQAKRLGKQKTSWAPKSLPKSSEVDMDRAMAIWNVFFENAAKRAFGGAQARGATGENVELHSSREPQASREFVASSKAKARATSKTVSSKDVSFQAASKASSTSPVWVCRQLQLEYAPGENENAENNWYWFDASPEDPALGCPLSSVWNEPLEWHKAPWVEYFDDESGCCYYSNESTGVTRWDPPTSVSNESSQSTENPNCMAPLSCADATALGWVEETDELGGSGGQYWHNFNLGMSVWSLLDIAKIYFSEGSDVPFQSLDWELHFDAESGASYWFNASTGESSWAGEHESGEWAPSGSNVDNDEYSQCSSCADWGGHGDGHWGGDTTIAYREASSDAPWQWEEGGHWEEDPQSQFTGYEPGAWPS